MKQQTLFDDEPPRTVPQCPNCKGEAFVNLSGGNGRMKCQRCGWLIVVGEDGSTRDALDWTRAGRKSGSRRSTQTTSEGTP